jgi:hypothetical protein
VLLAIELLGVAGGDERAELARGGGPTRAASRSFGVAELHALAIDGATGTPLAEIVGATADGLGKLLDGEHRQIQLSRKGRIGGAHPLRPLADRLLDVLGLDAQIHEHPGARELVRVVLGDELTLVVSDRLQELPQARCSALLARPLALGVAGLHPALALTPPQLAQLAAMARAEPDSLQRIVPRRWRKTFEVAAGGLAALPAFDPTSWRRAILQTATAAAAVIVDDLGAAAAGIDDRAEIAQLLRGWFAEPALRVRRALGLL